MRESFGHLTVITTTDHEGIFITVMVGSERISALCNMFPKAEREAAKAHYRLVRYGAMNGRKAYQIVNDLAVLRAAAVIAFGDQSAAYGPECSCVAASDTGHEAGCPRADWARGHRPELTREQTSAMHGLAADLATYGQTPQLRAAAANGVSADLSPAQRKIVDENRGQVVLAAGNNQRGYNWTTLRVIVEKGYADVVEKTGVRIKSIRIKEAA